MSEDERREFLIAKHAGRRGFRGRIDAKCIECIYDPLAAGTWRQQVEQCSDAMCPLYAVRAVSKPKVL